MGCCIYETEKTNKFKFKKNKKNKKKINIEEKKIIKIIYKI